jgi:TetR/AcrR family transcriptional repressor of nem operon
MDTSTDEEGFSLSAELNRCDGPLCTAGAEIFGRIIDGAETQFRQLGRRDARDLAITLLSGIQGSALLANTFRDVKIITRQTRHLEKWIDSLA